MRCRFLAILVLSISLVAHSQDTGSSAQRFDSSSTKTQSAKENPEDSLYRLKMERDIHEKGKDLEKFLADYKEYQEKEKRRMYTRYAVGVLFAAALIYGIVRKRKQQQKNKGV